MTGYYDQMHLVRDFRALAGDSPTGFERALTPFSGPLRHADGGPPGAGGAPAPPRDGDPRRVSHSY